MNKATVESVMALAKAYGNALGCSATDTRELKGVLRAEVERLAAQAEPAEQPRDDLPTYLDDLELRHIEVTEERDHLRAVLAAQAGPAPAPVGEYPAKALEAMEPVACLVNADAGAMVWPISDIGEAGTYCDEGEFPELLYPASAVSALQARIAELEQDAARGEPVGWQPLATAPKDGKEFIVRYPLQMNCKQLVYWNLIHGFWMTKGEALMGLGNQQAEWHPLPEDEPLPKETP